MHGQLVTRSSCHRVNSSQCRYTRRSTRHTILGDFRVWQVDRASATSWLAPDTVTACSVNSFKAKLQKLNNHSDEFLSGHWSPMNSSGQASFPGEANPVSYILEVDAVFSQTPFLSMLLSYSRPLTQPVRKVPFGGTTTWQYYTTQALPYLVEWCRYSSSLAPH